MSQLATSTAAADGIFRDGDGIVSLRRMTADEAQELGYDDRRKWVPGHRPAVALYEDGQEFTYWVKEEAKA